ncbi:hypothetical protein BDZ97DRAFT_1752502 [Flammula alnicola]|nr:hypothetical protein BDZ97DRAFT_1752502 [Flammula alnicola]
MPPSSVAEPMQPNTAEFAGASWRTNANANANPMMGGRMRQMMPTHLSICAQIPTLALWNLTSSQSDSNKGRRFRIEQNRHPPTDQSYAHRADAENKIKIERTTRQLYQAAGCRDVDSCKIETGRVGGMTHSDNALCPPVCPEDTLPLASQGSAYDCRPSVLRPVLSCVDSSRPSFITRDRWNLASSGTSGYSSFGHQFLPMSDGLHFAPKFGRRRRAAPETGQCAGRRSTAFS